jgi:proline racemase
MRRIHRPTARAKGINFIQHCNVRLLLGGGTKQRQQTAIDRAKAMWAEYKTRKAAAAKPRGKR